MKKNLKNKTLIIVLPLFIYCFLLTNISFSYENKSIFNIPKPNQSVCKIVLGKAYSIILNGDFSFFFDFKSLRSGGGGGGSRGGGSSSRSSSGFRSSSSSRGYSKTEPSTRIFHLIAGGLVVILFIYIIIKNKKYNKKNASRGFYTDKIEKNNQTKFMEFDVENPGFNSEEFLSKVIKAFFEIQYAWSAKDLSKVRKYISDGVYQRYNTQFKMMNLLGQENPLSKIEIKNISLQSCSVDGIYSSIDVKINAGMFDQFVCKQHPELNSPGGWEDFVEYWSFIKKTGSPTKDIFYTDNCPNCGAQLPNDMGEVCKCNFCGAFINSGEFDWVLSEITQESDYKTGNTLTASNYYQEKLKAFKEIRPDFSPQLVEDKASNGYLQILTAITLKEPAIMRRFVTDDAFEKFKKLITTDNIVYNRLYLNSVMLYDLNTKNDFDYLVILIKKSYQRIKMLENNRIIIIDSDIKQDSEYLVMQREVNSIAPKGSIYVHLCSSCGASIEDSIDIHCAYCGSLLNNSKNEWIIADIAPLDKLDKYLK